ncbi:MAG: hypothetical protein AAFO75_13340 [Pseudomonadota bacterium]
MTHWIGLAIVIVPILLILALFLKRPVWWFLVVLVAVGLGYLETTGANRDIGNRVLVEVNKIYPTGIEVDAGTSAEPSAAEPAAVAEPDAPAPEVQETQDTTPVDATEPSATDGAPVTP